MFISSQCKIGYLFSRLYWYRGVTVLLHAGLGYLEVLELSMQILLLVQLASVRLSTPSGGEEFLY
jgi:hypothetical protein